LVEGEVCVTWEELADRIRKKQEPVTEMAAKEGEPEVGKRVLKALHNPKLPSEKE
jgi:hypothetical protein